MNHSEAFWKYYLILSCTMLISGAAMGVFMPLDESIGTYGRIAILSYFAFGFFIWVFATSLLWKKIVAPLRSFKVSLDANIEKRPELPGVEFKYVNQFIDVCENRIGLAEAKTEVAERRLENSLLETEQRIAERTDEITKTNKLLEQEIHEREIAERILQANEERYYLAAQATNDLIYEHNLVPKRSPRENSVDSAVNFNDYGPSPDLIWLNDRIHPDDRDRIMSALSDVFAQGTKFWSEEYRFNQYGDNYAYIFDRGYIIYDENYQPTRMIGAMSDFTERKRAEDALKESEEKYRDVIENAHDIIYTIDLDGKFTSLNAAGQRLLGYSLDEACQKTIYSLVPPNHEKIINKMMNQKIGSSRRTDIEIDFLNAEGDRLTFEVSNRVVFQEMIPVGIQGIARNISERKWAEEQLRFNAMHDSLTSLPNRTLLLNQLRQAIARKYRNNDFKYAVLFLDIDRFKVINDSLGHLVGDKLLIGFAETLKNCVRTIDTVSRFGGDEFVLLLEDVGSLADAIQVAQRVLNSLSVPFKIDGDDIFTSTSIGITFSETGYKLPEEVLRDADTAMYRAKSSGKNCYQIFDQEMFISASNVLKTETDLRRAVERNEFELHYQPIVSLTDGHIIELEALLRWNHPTQGVVPPGEFVAIAEESGQIIPIGNWVIAEACKQLKYWQVSLNNEDLLMSVNLSPKQIARPDLAEFIGTTLEKLSLDPKNLNLEITESAIMENAKVAETLLHNLSSLGVRLTTDDFGTGYSSLSYLHKFPIDRLKIDRSFVWNMASSSKNLEIVRTILMLAKGLSMEVVAEGIETQEQLSMLLDLECQFGQGFLFSLPLSAEQATALLDGSNGLLPLANVLPSANIILDAEFSF